MVAGITIILITIVLSILLIIHYHRLHKQTFEEKKERKRAKMGMSMHVKGIPDREYFDKMLDLKEQCEKMKVELPKEVREFFGAYADETRACIEAEVLYKDIPHQKFIGQSTDGFKVKVSEIPKEIETILFYCSW